VNQCAAQNILGHHILVIASNFHGLDCHSPSTKVGSEGDPPVRMCVREGERTQDQLPVDTGS